MCGENMKSSAYPDTVGSSYRTFIWTGMECFSHIHVDCWKMMSGLFRMKSVQVLNLSIKVLECQIYHMVKWIRL